MEQVAKAIGYLIYAVASADNHVSPEEKRIVHEVINEQWKILADEEDPFGARALDFIDKIIVAMDEKQVESSMALELFKGIYTEKKELFTPELKQFILAICIKTGSAFNRMNKSELVLLSRIELLLKNE